MLQIVQEIFGVWGKHFYETENSFFAQERSGKRYPLVSPNMEQNTGQQQEWHQRVDSWQDQRHANVMAWPTLLPASSNITTVSACSSALFASRTKTSECPVPTVQIAPLKMLNTTHMQLTNKVKWNQMLTHSLASLIISLINIRLPNLASPPPGYVYPHDLHLAATRHINQPNCVSAGLNLLGGFFIPTKSSSSSSSFLLLHILLIFLMLLACCFYHNLLIKPTLVCLFLLNPSPPLLLPLLNKLSQASYNKEPFLFNMHLKNDTVVVTRQWWAVQEASSPSHWNQAGNSTWDITVSQ